jgi:adenine-specific DNA-methyltransferase
MAKKPTNPKLVETIIHDEAKRKNIPTAEHESVVSQNDKNSIKIKYPRNTDIDPQLVWRGKDEQDWSDLVVNAPPLYIQEKVHPKALIDDLLRRTKEEEHEAGMTTADLFEDFDGIPKDVDKTEFYSHDQNWSNRMILGDSLQVMASLAEREGLRGQVQCIYFDPPYGIKFNSNFQWSTTSREIKDGNSEHITREPEQVKAFRDTWRDGIHSYLTYLRDRLTVARDLLTDSGSIFVQIGDENVHRIRMLLEEVFGADCFQGQIIFSKSSSLATADRLSNNFDYIIWFAKKAGSTKYRELFELAGLDEMDSSFRRVRYLDGSRQSVGTKTDLSDITNKGGRFFRPSDLTKPGPGRKFEFEFEGRVFNPGKRWFGTTPEGLENAKKAGRLDLIGNTLVFQRHFLDTRLKRRNNYWSDTGFAGFNEDKIYVVQTSQKVIERCIQMTTDPGDLVLDPTCGSGTSAYVSEQWGRRWITIDTSRVALALARSRIMGARFPFYYLADSRDGQIKEADITLRPPSSKPTKGDIRHGFVYERIPHVTLKSIVNNLEISEIWASWEKSILESLADLNAQLGNKWHEWEVPRKFNANWSEDIKKTHGKFIEFLINRQVDIDKSIASKAENEFLYDRPYEDKKKVRVAGPFTVESLSPHRALGVDEDDNLIDHFSNDEEIPKQSFTQMILDNLKVAGVQQAHKVDKIEFSYMAPWPGSLVCAEGRYLEGNELNGNERRAAIFVGPEFGTVQKADLVQAAREAGDAGFDVLIACAFNYDAHATELNNLGRIPILKARMNADLHMSEDLKNTGKGNLFVIFGEPDIDVIKESDDRIRIKVNGVDVFKPQTGEVVSDGADGIACWFIDTDYNEESFFVRQAYFLGANDPYGSLKTSLKAEINADAWATLNSDISRIFPKPKSGRIAVKVINHLGDEVMKVFRI